MSRKRKIGIIGFGNMGSAIAERIKARYTVWLYDKDKNKLKGLKDIPVAQNNSDLVKKVDAVLLAVKPQDFDATLDEIRSAVSDKLIISIAAGIRTIYIEKFLGNVRVVRVMPNMPLRIGEGMSCLCKGRFATDDDLAFGQKLFDAAGRTLILDEGLMNAATAVSGSGPAYVCYYLESKKQNLLADFPKAAEGVGFSSKEAEFLVQATYSGTIDFLKKTKILPSELRIQVTSKGGTTEAALKVLDGGCSLQDAVKAALIRAEELSL